MQIEDGSQPENENHDDRGNKLGPLCALPESMKNEAVKTSNYLSSDNTLRFLIFNNPF